MRGRPGLRTAVALCLLGAFLVLVTVGRVWTSAEVPAGPLVDERTLTRTGAELVAGVQALGLVGLAGVVALAATRRVGRVLVGLVLLATGAGVLLSVLTADLVSGARRLDGLTAATPVTLSAWAWGTAAGGLLLALAGLLTTARGRSWSALGRRYEAPTAAAVPQDPTEQPTDKGLWEALDRGEDPTTSLGTSAGTRADREADRT